MNVSNTYLADVIKPSRYSTCGCALIIQADSEPIPITKVHVCTCITKQPLRLSAPNYAESLFCSRVPSIYYHDLCGCPRFDARSRNLRACEMRYLGKVSMRAGKRSLTMFTLAHKQQSLVNPLFPHSVPGHRREAEAPRPDEHV